ncbi:baseplate assembly protein [Gibbsiella dentisursi]|uniref:Baseplate assembly protein n=1 Tax=Gibbsiella dentisursi TaxID=796890 RepID=A0ABP7M1I7_9GAMM
MSDAIDLSQLPAPDVVETIDYETLLDARTTRLLALVSDDLRDAVTAALALESEPLRKLLEENAYREMVLRQRINEAARAVMLAFATGNDLDQIAANYGITRLTITPADDTTTPPTAAVMESDDNLRTRVQSSMEALSVAGPREAYQYHARSASGKVADAYAFSPAPACVTVVILSTEGDGTADDALISTVDEALSDEDVRPIADRLAVQSAEIVNYSITATLYLASDGPESEVIKTTAEAQLTAYTEARHRIGKSIYREKIAGVLNCDGVENIDITAPPADISITRTQASFCTGYTLNIERLLNDDEEQSE